MKTRAEPPPVAGVTFPNPGGHTGQVSESVVWRLVLAPLCGLTFALFAAGPTVAADAKPALDVAPREWSLSARWENDTFGGSDRFYTDGVSLSLAHTGRSWLDPVADWLRWGKGRRTVGYDFGQIMVTPSDTSLPVPDPNDRPYAGILYVRLSLHVERDNYYNGLKFITGVVGPWSLAEETQKQVHRWVGADLPQGWDYQLHNEPILNLVYEHRRKYRLLGTPRGLAVEALPVGNVMLGNVLAQGQLGGQFRFGYNIRRFRHDADARDGSPAAAASASGGRRAEMERVLVRRRQRQSRGPQHHARRQHVEGQPQRGQGMVCARGGSGYGGVHPARHRCLRLRVLGARIRGAEGLLRVRCVHRFLPVLNATK
ncbi:MAG: lipid A deacylase LpxR family protein [Verrucomicrobiales bacterium]|nr:lipid A deacylase LpxR family protein [Verrucomicrobiales bacterium]